MKSSQKTALVTGSAARIGASRDPALLLALRDGVQCQGRLAARLRAVDLHDAAAGVATDTETEVEGRRAGGNRGDLGGLAIAQTHDGTLAVLLFDRSQRQF